MFKCGIKKYIEELASDKPVPGGGSAAALAGALGAGLMEKVCNFTIGKERYRAVENEMCIILKEATIARKRLIELIELDKKAFLPVAKAYKLPKDTDEQKATRRQKIDEANKMAAKVPEEIKNICVKLFPFCDKLEKSANQLFTSDTRCCRELLKAASEGARYFV